MSPADKYFRDGKRNQPKLDEIEKLVKMAKLDQRVDSPVNKVLHEVDRLVQCCFDFVFQEY